MHVGLYFDMRNPPRWHRPWPNLYAQALERVVEAERLGLRSAWFSEHHLFEDGYLPQPLLVAAAAAARTTRMRLGTSILVAPLRSALDIAEQAAVVDILSGGRVELGLGAGYRIPEFEAFGVDVDRRFELLRKRAVEIRSLWDRGIVTPPPIQPRPPIWIGARGPVLTTAAGRTGEGLMTLDAGAFDHYRRAVDEAGHPPQTARVAGPVNLILADDPDAAWRQVKPHLAYQWETYRRYGAEDRRGDRGAAALRATDSFDPDSLRSPGPAMNPPQFDVVTPAEAIRRMRAWLEPLPVVHAYFWSSIAGMPDALAERHLELLASEVAPAVADLGHPSARG